MNVVCTSVKLLPVILAVWLFSFTAWHFSYSLLSVIAGHFNAVVSQSNTELFWYSPISIRFYGSRNQGGFTVYDFPGSARRSCFVNKTKSYCISVTLVLEAIKLMLLPYTFNYSAFYIVNNVINRFTHVNFMSAVNGN